MDSRNEGEDTLEKAKTTAFISFSKFDVRGNEHYENHDRSLCVLDIMKINKYMLQSLFARMSQLYHRMQISFCV